MDSQKRTRGSQTTTPIGSIALGIECQNAFRKLINSLFGVLETILKGAYRALFARGSPLPHVDRSSG
jgi:hypothetical protein